MNEAPRKPCPACARKHLAQATVLLQESVQGYPEHRWLAVGHVAEAEAEIFGMFPDIADLLRQARHKVESSEDAMPDLMGFVKEITMRVEGLTMNRQAAAQELVRLAKELVGYGFIQDFLRLRDGGRILLSGKNASVYAHVWFDIDVARDDFGNRVPDSGEWEVIITDSENFVGGRELARKNFRYADPKMRESVASMASDWTAKVLTKL